MSILDPKPLTAAAAADQAGDPASPLGAALSATYLPGDSTGATAGQVPTWDAALGKFKPGTPAAGGASERPTWATTVHDFDTDLSLYNPAALSKVRQQFARAVNGSKVFKILFSGDSITFGATQSPPYNLYSFPSRFRLALEKRYKSAGTGITPTWAGTLNDSRLTQSGAWTDYRDRGFATHTTRATGTGNTATYAGITCDSFKLYFLKDTTEGTFTLTIDGGAPINIDASAASEAIGVYTSPALTLGSHTFVVTAPATGNVTLFGMEGLIAGGAVKVSAAGYSGAGISTIAQAATPAAPRIMMYHDSPDLAVVMLETNDYGNAGTPIATYKANWDNVLTAAAAAGTTVLIVAGMPVQAPRSAPGGSPSHADYHRALYELADQYNQPLLDFQHRWGTWAQANAAGLMADDYHPNSDGHQAMAMHYLKVLDPGWGNQILGSYAGTGENTYTGKQTVNAEGSVVQPADGAGTLAGLRVNSATSRTAPLLAIGPKNGTGTGDFLKVGATGGLRIDSAKQVGDGPLTISAAFANVLAVGTGNSWAGIGVQAQAANQVPIVAKAIASQTAPLTQYVSSAGVVIGSITAEGAFKPLAVATASRPSASTVGAGAMIYDTTLGKPIWSNGTAWTDATGATV